MEKIKIIIIETTPKSTTNIDAHVRNAFCIYDFLKKQKDFDVSFVFSLEPLPLIKFDLILVSYASFYAKYANKEEFFEINKETPSGWITNEYNLQPNGWFHAFFKKNPKSFIVANFEKSALRYNCFRHFHFVNLNTLIFNERPLIEKKYDFIYYGTFRPDRAEYFKKYLHKEFYVSTSTKNQKEFLHVGADSKFIQKINWQSNLLQKFRFSLYIEDVFTHTHFNNLANRFYEAVANNVVLLFDKNCEKTLVKSKLKNYKDFIVNSYEDCLKFKNKNYFDLLELQKNWRLQAIKEKEETLQRILFIVNKNLNK